MINKLKKKVFLILNTSISVILIGVIIIFAYMNYQNTLNTATVMMDRFNEFDKKQIDMKEPPTEIADTEKQEPPEMTEGSAIDGNYYFAIEDGKIISNSGEKNSQLEELALKAYNKNKESGIIENYIYKTQKDKMTNKTIIMLTENETTIIRIKFIYIISVTAGILVIILTYVISKKITNMIVKPVEETIEKQKQFISDASHELKTPLAVIEANAEVLENQVGTSKWMQYIQSEIASMDKLINNLLYLAKTENIKEIKNKETFDLSSEIKMISSMFESMAYEKKIEINYNIAENIKFNGAKEDIKRILSTLIENAIMHTKENGKIYIELNKEKNNTIIQVKNEGEPIPEAEREKIFERFYRVDKSRNRKEKRYGLGLAIAKSIVEQYNGKIEVQCNNEITTFKVTII